MKKKSIFICLIIFTISIFAQKNNANLIMYDNYVLIVEESSFDVTGGENTLVFPGLLGNILDNSVFIYFPGNENVKLISKKIESNPLSIDRILADNIGNEVELISNDQKIVTGKLLQVSGNRALIDVKNGEVKIIDLNKYEFSNLRYDSEKYFNNRLTFSLYSENKRSIESKICYFSNLLLWKCEHAAYYDENKRKIDLKSWVRIINNSKYNFNNAGLTLISGEIKRPELPRAARRVGYDIQGKAMAAESAAPGFGVEKTFEYYSYEYSKPVSINKEDYIEFPLSDKTEIGVKKTFLFNSRLNPNDVFVILEVDNKKDNNFGVPIPKGMVKIFTKGSEKITYLGSDLIEDTPEGEKLNLKIGKSFDLKGERVLKERTRITNRIYEEEVNINITNSSDIESEIKVVEMLYGDWTILSSNIKYNKVSAGRVEFVIPVKGHSTNTIEYRARFK